MSAAYWLNSAWMLSCLREAGAFRRATSSVAETQETVLRTVLRRNRRTEFGARHEFGCVASVVEYRRRVPLSAYGDYAPEIRRIAAGKQTVLTADRVELLEPTSGSTGGEKWIPYTASLRAEFQRGLAAWVADVMRHRPAMRRGRAYWSISPALARPRCSEGGVLIGFDSDAAYLGRWQRLAVERLLVVPSAAAALTDPVDFRYFTLFHLLAAADVSLISVWSPTFLTALLAPLPMWRDRICDDLRRGRLNLPSGEGLAGIGDSRLGARQRRRRSDELATIFRRGGSLPDQLRQIWPRLDLISCWGDATAAAYLPFLTALFPHVAVQPKGLLATEACVSIPLCGRSGAALAVRSHFFEFRPLSGEFDQEASHVVLAHELDTGCRYQVIVTTGGGLYRYQLGDVVEVTGYENQCPLLRLVGRHDRVCDLVGEKLAEPHVQESLHRVFDAHRISPRFALVAPLAGDVPGYCLYLQGDLEQLAAVGGSASRDVEHSLRENPYYRQAVDLGQLRPIEMQILHGQFQEIWQVYERACVARGTRLGQVKTCVLDTRTDWSEKFSRFLAARATQENGLPRSLGSVACSPSSMISLEQRS